MSRSKLIAALLIFAAGCWLGHTVTENRWLTQNRKANEQITRSLQASITAEQQAPAARETEKNRLRREKEICKDGLCEVFSDDQNVQSWSADDVPGPVAQWLCIAMQMPRKDDTDTTGDLSARCARARFTNGALVTWILDLLEALRLSNTDKKALREWSGN